MTWTNSFDVQPLNFQDTCDRSGANSSTCIVVGLAVVMAYLYLQQQRQEMMALTHSFRAVPAYAAGMVSRVTDRVSARIGTTSTSDITDVGDTKATSATETEKETNKKKVLAWMQSNSKNGIILIYASWCPHCHTALSEIAQLKPTHASVPLLKINADTVPTELLTASGIHQVEFFPCLLVVQAGKVSPASNVKDAFAATTPPPATAAKVSLLAPSPAKEHETSTLDTPFAPEEEANNPFDTLF